MMDADNIPFGLLELDAAGKVRSYSPTKEPNTRVIAAEIIGSDFFRTLIPCAELNRFRVRFATFMISGEWIERTTFSVRINQKTVQIQIVLVCLSQQMPAAPERMALVRIRPETVPPDARVAVRI